MFSNTTLVLERRPGRLRLYLGGDLQFDTDDEVIYHERLAHPALLAARARLAGPLHLLVLGGGDGLLARELLRHEGVASVRVIDYNPEVLALAGTELVPWNESSYANPEFDRLLTQAEGILEADKRRVVMAKLEQILQEDGPIVQPLWRTSFTFFDKKVKGFSIHPTGFIFANKLALERQDSPRDDLVSVLMRGEVDGERLTEMEFDMFFLLLAIAGNETTRNLISGGMLALIEHPQQRARLLADPSLLNKAVEEMLRWVSPVMHFRRTATRDVDLRGQRVAKGDKVAIFYPSANRDEEVFPRADQFDVGEFELAIAHLRSPTWAAPGLYSAYSAPASVGPDAPVPLARPTLFKH